MNRLPLPVVDPTRTEFGFERTHCACPECNIHCRHIPGYLVPADLGRMAAFHQPKANIVTWALDHLLASPGALVARDGVRFRIPTLVPGRRADDACVFLTQEGTCGIHPVAPFGCAFFDAHMTTSQADRRSSVGLRAVARAWHQDHAYAAVWQVLNRNGQVAPTPETARQRLCR